MAHFCTLKNDQFSGVPEIPDISVRLQPFEVRLISFERAINGLHAHVI